MKDKIENVPAEFRGSLRPHSTYASSASSTSSYASSLSSASSASSSGSAPESLKSTSFLHSKASQQAVDNIEAQYPHYASHQYHTLRRYPSGTPSPTTPQLSTPSPSSPSSSPASSTVDGYATIPAKFATLSVHPSNTRQDPRIHYSHPSVPTTPVVNNFRHSVISTPTAGPSFGDQVSNRLAGSNYNLTRVNDVGSRTAINGSAGTPVGTVGAGMRGVSSLGEVTSSSHRSPRYASTPHLFVFQTQDDDDEDSEGVGDTTNMITKTNTLSNRSPVAIVEVDPMAAGSRTLPRQPMPSQPPHQQKEPIYSSTAEIKKDVTRREEEAARHISDHYEAPRNLSAGRRSSSCSMISQDSFAVTNQVVARIETSFRGHKTQLWVCRTMANLYTEEGTGKDATWNLKFTGVPVLLLDLGETKSRDKRRLQIILAEKESGFELWKDVIDNLTSYKVQEHHFHTMYLSSDHRRKIGLSFNEGQAAMAFHSQLETLTSDPENISLSAPGKKKIKSKDKPPKYKAPRKTNISLPCNFHHVTTVDPADRSRLYSMQVYGSGPANGVVAPEPHTLVNRPIPPPTAATAV